MVEINISKQVNKILSRFDKKILSSPSYTKTIENIRKDYTEPTKSSTKDFSKESSKNLLNIKELYQESIGKYLKQSSPRSRTPDISFVPHQYENRSATPVQTKSTTQILKSLFQPKLNKNSLKIASRLGEAKDRLTSTSTPKIISTDEQFTYQPEINKRSQKLVGLKNNGKQRWENLYSLNEEKKKELERLRTENEIKDRNKEEMYFKPSILQSSVRGNTVNVAERLNNWAKVKQNKLKERKDNDIDKDMKECTFMPKTIDIAVSDERLETIKGVNTYIERGKFIKSKNPLENTVVNTGMVRDMNKKKYKEIMEALHDELQSLEL